MFYIMKDEDSDFKANIITGHMPKFKVLQPKKWAESFAEKFKFDHTYRKNGSSLCVPLSRLQVLQAFTRLFGVDQVSQW
jgi:hypothetical protein